MTSYYISRNVYFCFAGESCVWFDVTRDKYFGSSAKQCAHLGSLVEGWKGRAVGGNESERASESDVQEIAEQHVARGLLTRDARYRQTPTAAIPEPARGSLISDDSLNQSEIKWHHVVRFLWACLVAVVTFKVFSLRYALDALARRKSKRTRHQHEANIESANELLDVFVRLRVFVYTARKSCLFDSIVLAWFLGSYGQFPDFVIGVAVQPFRAHCWLQYFGLVLNGAWAYTAQFTPIYTI